jgi:putative DNA primase/helicase
MSIQRIKADGDKRFLAGGRTKNTVFVINKKFMSMGVYLCEGFATGLSIQAGLEALFRKAAVVVCFSASNMIHVGRQIKRACVFADHDDTGIRAAEELGFPWMKSEAAGEDANDLHKRAGIMALRQALSGLCPANRQTLRG